MRPCASTTYEYLDQQRNEDASTTAGPRRGEEVRNEDGVMRVGGGSLRLLLLRKLVTNNRESCCWSNGGGADGSERVTVGSEATYTVHFFTLTC